jgi:hypothetical protein
MSGWAQMWALAFAVYAGCKILTWRTAAAGSAPAWKHVAYLMAWPGMDAENFLAGVAGGPCSRCRAIEWVSASRGMCAYVAVFWGIRVVLQAVFDVREHLTAWWLKAGYRALTMLFLVLTIVYALGAVR